MTEQKIYPLCPDRIDISYNQEDDEYKVYERLLNAAFKNSSVRNIAVTGNFGIGKSRFLRYYGRDRNFLFVSGCSFMEPDMPDGKTEMEQVEYNLMYQLFLGCRRESGAQLNLLILLGVMTGLLLLFTAFLLLLAPMLELYFKEQGWYNGAVSTVVHTLVYAGLIVILCIDMIVLLSRGRYILRLKSVSLELGAAKLSIENQNIFSFLDHNRNALLLSLIDAAKKGRTVVFEDMDRLEKADCLALFAKLWELNQMVNLYIDEARPIRFIYVLHDQLFSPNGTENSVAFPTPDAYVQLKFFDYILPIVPSMSQKNAIIVAKSLLEDDDDLDEILTVMSPHLSDYRLLRNIANEYQVFSGIEKVRHKVQCKGEKSSIISALRIFFGGKLQDNRAKYTPAKEEKVNLLSFVIYKNLMPWDYKKIRENGSAVLPMVSDADKLPKAVQILLEKKWLDADCLHFVGYDRERLQDYIKAVFQQGKGNSESKKYWLEHEFDLCCGIDDFKPNLEGVEFTFAEMAVRSGKEEGISILKKYMGGPAVEICSQAQLEQMHMGLGLHSEESALTDEEKLTILYFLSRMGCHILWKMVPGSTEGLDTAEDFWWNLFCRLDEDTLNCLDRCCEYKTDDLAGPSNYLENWIKHSSIFGNKNWREQVPQDSQHVKKYIESRSVL